MFVKLPEILEDASNAAGAVVLSDVEWQLALSERIPQKDKKLLIERRGLHKTQHNKKQNQIHFEKIVIWAKSEIAGFLS